MEKMEMEVEITTRLSWEW